MEELGLSGVDDLDGKLKNIAPTHPPNLHSFTLIFNSKIARIYINNLDCV